MSTATIILHQLGGNRFIAMTGAKDIIDLGDGLKAKLGRNAKGITHLQITITPDDTYEVTFLRIRKHGLEVFVKAAREGIYADQLRPLIEKETGLFLSL